MPMLLALTLTCFDLECGLWNAHVLGFENGPNIVLCFSKTDKSSKQMLIFIVTFVRVLVLLPGLTALTQHLSTSPSQLHPPLVLLLSSKPLDRLSYHLPDLLPQAFRRLPLLLLSLLPQST